MITIYHGDDTASSRNAFLVARQHTEHPKVFDGTKVTLTDLVQVIEGGGFFDTEKKIFVEDFFTKRKPSGEVDDIVAYLQKHQTEAEISFWDGKELPKKTTSVFSKATIKQFALPQSLFQFLDAIRPESTKQTLSLFHQTIEVIEVEVVFSMIVRQFRILLAVSEISSETIDEVKRLAPWQMKKFQKQAAYFASEKLVQIHKELFTIEHETKTGKTPLTLSQSLDFFLLRL